MFKQDYSPFEKLIPPIYHKKTIVAGGAAVDFVKASDVDIWVFGIGQAEAVETIGTWLRLQGVEFEVAPKGEGSVSQDWIETIRPYTMDEHGYRKPAQIMVCGEKCQSVTDVLDLFDISTHKAARSLTGEWLADAKTSTTVPTAQARILNFTTPTRTLNRLWKICGRYQIQPNPVDVYTLVLLAEAEKKSGKIR